ncbi:hypothetical protein EUBVEN_01973 [Eubacterium ventriosum ATCC 27560]|uniref:Uncharacterized protein n=1 Tax=Eubacterium ventriosum ATCC 27560 TaxID=411463 RepID=A5Z8D2_9FIRM|nr:hypothetical protein EUBVEN_01973 [Eubacterium ventriosum ATCC 27560]
MDCLYIKVIQAVLHAIIFCSLPDCYVLRTHTILPVHSHITQLRFAFLLMFGARLKVFSAPLCKHRCSKTFLRCKLHIFF